MSFLKKLLGSGGQDTGGRDLVKRDSSGLASFAGNPLESITHIQSDRIVPKAEGGEQLFIALGTNNPQIINSHVVPALRRHLERFGTDVVVRGFPDKNVVQVLTTPELAEQVRPLVLPPISDHRSASELFSAEQVRSAGYIQGAEVIEGKTCAEDEITNRVGLFISPLIDARAVQQLPSLITAAWAHKGVKNAHLSGMTGRDHAGRPVEGHHITLVLENGVDASQVAEDINTTVEKARASIGSSEAPPRQLPHR